MERKLDKWTVTELREQIGEISFPEYQREPTVWDRDAKQRLIDSMLRRFDIAPLYFYRHDDGALDCVDGRQRIGAIMSFLGENQDAEERVDNFFPLVQLNEVYTDDEQRLPDTPTFRELEVRAKKDPAAARIVKAFLGYELNIVELSDSARAEEFNLQFIRLNLGTIVNSGEKLHAMIGDIRNVCFKEGELGEHPFLVGVDIPTRRFAKEQVAAQILAQVFALREEGDFARTRHFDLQLFFKEYAKLDGRHRGYVQDLGRLLDLLASAFDGSKLLRNRAITVSVVLLAMVKKISTAGAAKKLAEFMAEFLCRLKWQVAKGLTPDSEYHWIIDFQRHVTQASVEKSAVAERARVLDEEFTRWTRDGVFQGDAKYRSRTKKEPGKDCRGG